MEFALVNPNRFLNPPVIPVGLEYIAHSLRQAGHDVDVIDLCFCVDPGSELTKRLRSRRPDAVFMSIRNADSAIRAEDNFYLDEHRIFAQIVTQAGLPLIVGGSALPAMPDEIRNYLGADTAVNGPGEKAVLEVAETLAAGRKLPALIDGFAAGIDPLALPQRATDIDYSAYYAKQGIAGFASSYGCPSRCMFCIEAGTGALFRDVNAVAAEVRPLVDHGWRQMHLCDAEMNISYAHALSLCKALTGTGAEWITYLRPQPMDAALAEAMRTSNCTMATVSINSHTDDPEAAAASVRTIKDAGVRVAVDLSAGLPGESPEQIQRMIHALHAAQPERVGINVRYRLYPATRLAGITYEQPEERRYVSGDPAYVRPASYGRIAPADIQKWIAGLPGFAIDLGEGVNYQHLNQDGRHENTA